MASSGNPASQSSILPAGTLLAGRYRIEGAAGEGAMGEVYRGRDENLGRAVAIKRVRLDLEAAEGVAERFQREARALAQIDNPQVVQILDAGTDQVGGAFFVMPLLSGQSLADRLEESKALDWREAGHIALGMARALRAAHAHAVHRDLKPSNVFLCAGDSPQAPLVKVIDFGVAKLVGNDPLNRTLTRTGEFVGTPLYASLEQLNGSKAVDHRTDIFSLGAILYEMLTGQPPVSASMLGELIMARLNSRPMRPEDLRINAGALGVIAMKCLQRDPQDRYQSAQELETDLATACHDQVPADTRVLLQDPGLIATAPPGTVPEAPALAVSRPSAGVEATGPAPDQARRVGPSAARWVGGAVATLMAVAAVVLVMRERPPSAKGAQPSADFKAQPKGVTPQPATIQAPLADPAQGPGAPAPEAPAPGAVKGSTTTSEAASEAVAQDPSATGRPSKDSKQGATHVLRVVTEPSGASVRLKGGKGCRRTPCDVHFEVSGEPQQRVTLRIRREGHAEQRLKLGPPFKARARVELAPLVERMPVWQPGQ